MDGDVKKTMLKRKNKIGLIRKGARVQVHVQYTKGPLQKFQGLCIKKKYQGVQTQL